MSPAGRPGTAIAFRRKPDQPLASRGTVGGPPRNAVWHVRACGGVYFCCLSSNYHAKESSQHGGHPRHEQAVSPGWPRKQTRAPSQCEGEGWRASAIDLERAVRPAESRRRPVAAERRSMCREQPQWEPGRSWAGAESDTPWLGTEQLVARPAWR